MNGLYTSEDILLPATQNLRAVMSDLARNIRYLDPENKTSDPRPKKKLPYRPMKETAGL